MQVVLFLIYFYSASMKDRLALVQESLQFMVKQLRHGDKLAVITFDHQVMKLWNDILRILYQVEVVLPLTDMTTAGKELAKKAIQGIKERGHTNLSAGLLAALQVLYKIHI